MPDFWKLKEGFLPIEDEANKEETTEQQKEETKENEEKTEAENKSETVEANEDGKEAEKKEGAEDSENEEAEGKTEKEEEEEEEKEQEEVTSEVSEEPAEEKEERSLNKISELTEGQFKSEEDIIQAYNELSNKVSGKTFMEQINSQIEDIHGEGVTFSDVLEFKNKDFDNMDSMDLIVENLYLKDPDITDSEIRAELRQYKLLEKSESEINEMIEDGTITQDDIDDLKAKVTRDARIAKSALKEFQGEINIDDLEVHSPVQPQEPEQQPSPEEIEAQVKKYNQTIDNLKETVIQVGTDDEPYEVKIEYSDEDRNGIKEFLSGNETQSWSQARWFNEDGTVNIDLLAKDVNKIRNYERDMKISFQQGKSAGVKKEVKDIDNVDFNNGKTRDVTSEGISEAAKVVRDINQ